MLDKMNYYQKAHRLSLYDIADTVTDVHQGQLFQLNAEGKWEYADGTRKAYPTLNSRYSGQGVGLQFERLEGRDDVTRSNKIACLKGNFEIGTDQYDESVVYTPGAALYPSTDPTKPGKITLFDSANVAHKIEFIAGYVTQVPEQAGDFLRYEG